MVWMSFIELYIGRRITVFLLHFISIIIILSWMIIHIRIRTVASHDNNMKIRVTHIDLVCVAFYDVSIVSSMPSWTRAYILYSKKYFNESNQSDNVLNGCNEVVCRGRGGVHTCILHQIKRIGILRQLS